jgi:hypothetical protein
MKRGVAVFVRSLQRRIQNAESSAECNVYEVPCQRIVCYVCMYVCMYVCIQKEEVTCLCSSSQLMSHGRGWTHFARCILFKLRVIIRLITNTKSVNIYINSVTPFVQLRE